MAEKYQVKDGKTVKVKGKGETAPKKEGGKETEGKKKGDK